MCSDSGSNISAGHSGSDSGMAIYDPNVSLMVSRQTYKNLMWKGGCQGGRVAHPGAADG